MMAALARTLSLLLCCGLAAPLFALRADTAAATKQIKEMLAREKAGQAARETKRREVLGKLDQLNQNQNQVRKRLTEMGQAQAEMNMAAQNLALEIQKQKEAETVSRQRLTLILKLVYRIHRDGILRFAMSGGDLGAMVKRVRVLYRTLRSNTSIAEQMRARSKRLAECEQKLGEARQSMLRMTAELKEQEGLLGTFLEQKKRVLAQLKTDDKRYEALKDQYQEVHEQVKTLFDGIDKNSAMYVGKTGLVADNTFVAPLEFGVVAKRFGKTVHDKFRTVVLHKGIEVEADHRSPVFAVADGKVEFEGWIKGLGNVVVLQHAGGYFSLSAHLFESTVKTGDIILQDKQIGSVGDTGTSARPSLYFELRHRGKAVDPLTKFQIPSQRFVAKPGVIKTPLPEVSPEVLLPQEASFGD